MGLCNRVLLSAELAYGHHSAPDMGRVTEASETWSLLIPKCAMCQAPHLPHQMATACEEGLPTSGGRRRQGLGARRGLWAAEGHGSGKWTEAKVLGTGRSQPGIWRGEREGLGHVGGDKRVSELADGEERVAWCQW